MDKPNSVNWVIGRGANRSILKLWNSYCSKVLSQQVNNLSFKNFCLKKLGVEDIDISIIDTNKTSFLYDEKTLSKINSFLKDEQGNSLRKIMSEDIESRIWFEIECKYPTAKTDLQTALQYLEQISPSQYYLLDNLCRWVIPIHHHKNGKPHRRGFSHIQHLGCIFTSFEERAPIGTDLMTAMLSIDLMHEIGHQALMLYQLADPILKSSPNKPIYSSVRRKNRMAIMSLHACVATAYMMNTCEMILTSGSSTDQQLAYAGASLKSFLENQRVSLNELSNKVIFTKLGHKIFIELQNQTDQLTNNFNLQGFDSPGYYGVSGL